MYATAVSLLIVAALSVYFIFDPEESGLFPKCLFHSITGLKCPGCGIQRAFHQLLNGNFTGALHYNALAIVSMPYILLGIVLFFLPSSHTTDKLHRVLYEGKAVYIALAVIILFWILRNIVPGL